MLQYIRIKRLIQMGLINKWREIALNRMPGKKTKYGFKKFRQYSTKQQEPDLKHYTHKFSFIDARTIFIMWLGGNFIAFIILIFEIFPFSKVIKKILKKILLQFIYSLL